jgi:hypothetical protein
VVAVETATDRSRGNARRAGAVDPTRATDAGPVRPLPDARRLGGFHGVCGQSGRIPVASSFRLARSRMDVEGRHTGREPGRRRRLRRRGGPVGPAALRSDRSERPGHVRAPSARGTPDPDRPRLLFGSVEELGPGRRADVRAVHRPRGGGRARPRARSGRSAGGRGRRLARPERPWRRIAGGSQRGGRLLRGAGRRSNLRRVRDACRLRCFGPRAAPRPVSSRRRGAPPRPAAPGRRRRSDGVRPRRGRPSARERVARRPLPRRPARSGVRGVAVSVDGDRFGRILPLRRPARGARAGAGGPRRVRDRDREHDRRRGNDGSPGRDAGEGLRGRGRRPDGRRSSGEGNADLAGAARGLAGLGLPPAFVGGGG